MLFMSFPLSFSKKSDTVLAIQGTRTLPKAYHCQWLHSPFEQPLDKAG